LIEIQPAGFRGHGTPRFGGCFGDQAQPHLPETGRQGEGARSRQDRPVHLGLGTMPPATRRAESPAAGRPPGRSAGRPRPVRRHRPVALQTEGAISIPVVLVQGPSRAGIPGGKGQLQDRASFLGQGEHGTAALEDRDPVQGRRDDVPSSAGQNPWSPDRSRKAPRGRRTRAPSLRFQHRGPQQCVPHQEGVVHLSTSGSSGSIQNRAGRAGAPGVGDRGEGVP
jgi:hypothetical protein